jgi:recombination protein RecA
VARSGAHYSYDGQRLGQGRGQAGAFLGEHPEVAGEIEGGVYAATGIAAAWGAERAADEPTGSSELEREAA